MACLPLFWRMMQCLGRYSATKHVEVRTLTSPPANITSHDTHTTHTHNASLWSNR
jgi:hypothetical protein